MGSYSMDCGGSHCLTAGRKIFRGAQGIFLDSCVKEFFRRRISYPNDTINAIAGVISWFNKNSYPVWALSGLVMGLVKPKHSRRNWYEYAFLHALDWSHSARVKRKPEFPSWTWAGWEIDDSDWASVNSPYLFQTSHEVKPCSNYIIMADIRVGGVFESSTDTITWLKIEDLNIKHCNPVLCANYLLLHAWDLPWKDCRA